MQGAIAMPPPAAITQNRYIKLPDGSYKDTITGQVFPSSGPPPQGAIAAPSPANVDPRGGPILQTIGAIKDFMNSPARNAAKSPIQLDLGAMRSQTPPNVLTRENAPIPDVPPTLPPKPLAAQGGAIAAPAPMADSRPQVPSMPLPSTAERAISAARAGAINAQNPQGPQIPTQNDPSVLAMGAINAQQNGLGAVKPPIMSDGTGTGGITGTLDNASGMGGYAGALGVPGNQPIANVGALDLSGDIAKEGSDVAKNLGPAEIGGSYWDRLSADPQRMMLLRAGLGTMAAAGQPGASAFGAIGQGGLSALQQAEHDKDREEERAWREKVFGAEQANQASDRSFKIAEWLTGRSDKAADRAIAQQRANTEEKNAVTTAGYRQGQLANQSASEARQNKALGLQAAQFDETRKKNSVEAQNMWDDNYAKAFDEYLATQKPNGTQSLESLFNPQDAEKLKTGADDFASRKFPMAHQAQASAKQQLQGYLEAFDQAKALNNSQAADHAKKMIADIVETFFPDVKTNDLLK